MMGLAPFKSHKRACCLPLLPAKWGYNRKSTVCDLEEDPPKNRLYWHSQLGLPAPRAVRNESLWLVPPSLW